MNNGVNFNYANNRDGLVSAGIFKPNIFYSVKLFYIYS